jgi:hypothetical protein
MAVQRVNESQKVIGLSTDTKPTDVSPGSTYHELNTGQMFIYDGTIWREDLSIIHALEQAIRR